MIRKYKNRQLPKGILVDRGLVFIRIYRNGKPFLEGFGKADVPSNIALAIAKLNEYRESIRNEKFGFESKAKRIQSSEAVDLFLSLRNIPLAYSYQLLGFKSFTDGMWYDSVNHIKMEGYRPFRLEQGVSESTVNRELTAISAMYYRLKKLIQLHEIEALKLPEISPCLHVKRFDERLVRRKRVLSTEEFHSFMSVATPRVQRACLGALNTALRKKDLFALEKTNRAGQGGQLEGVQTKVGSLYVVPDNENMTGLFNTAGGKVFDITNFKGEFKASRKRWLETFPKAERAARHFVFKDLRRTALRKVYDETKDILLCRDLAGHTDVRTTQLYLGLTTSDIKRAGSVLGKAFSYELPADGGQERGGGAVEGKQIGFKARGL